MKFTLHHVALASPKAPEAVGFYTADWGLREVGRDDRAVRLAAADDRGDDYSLVLITAEHKSVDHFCLVTDDRDDLAVLRDRVQDIVVHNDAPACPGVEDSFLIRDLDGRLVEIGYHPAAEPDGEQPPDAVPHKPAHIVLNTTDIEAITAWYQEKLGFGLRDFRAKKMSFLYYNRDHHTVAFNAAPHASLNHVAYELDDINQFFRAIARASQTTSGEQLYGPGRHGPGNYCFCYFLDPMGFMCEFETGGDKVDDPADYPYRTWEYTPQNTDQWLGVLSGGPNQRWRKAALGQPDPGLTPSNR
jgi:catechol 2,3-dioxygenase-like lactoylglutathione lyase family enzyme